MGAPHGHLLHYHAHSVVHRLPAHVKIVTLLSFVIVVVATPPERMWAFTGYAALLAAVVGVSRVPPGYIAVRMVVELPFVVFALLLPFIATGPRVSLGPLTVSEAGLWGAWGLLVKGTLGVVASLVLATTTQARDLVAGLQRLRVPAAIVAILAFMLRYLEVVGAELTRMRIARESRGFQPRSIRAWPVLARSMGALFIRSYERGERVHLAMLSRGFTGALPLHHDGAAHRREWVLSAMLPATALAVLLVAVLV